MKKSGSNSPAVSVNLTAGLSTAQNGTMLKFTTQYSGIVTLTLYDITGREVRTFAPIAVSDGSSHEMMIHHSGLASGVYTLVISNGLTKQTLRFPVIQ